MLIALLLFFSAGCGGADARPAGSAKIDVESEASKLAELAERVAEDAHALLREALDSRWGIGYCMLKPSNLTREEREEYYRIKRFELRVRGHFDPIMKARGDDVRFGFLAYRDFMVLVERPWDSPHERNAWRSASGGDMFPRAKFGHLKLGEPVDRGSYAVEKVDGGVLIGVPVLVDGFAGALYLAFKGEPVKLD